MPEQKTYVPKSSAKQITFQSSGKTIIKISFKANELIEFVNGHVNASGYINLGISERREVGPYGDTHCVWLDTWQPKPKTDASAKSRYIPPDEQPETKGDDVPF